MTGQLSHGSSRSPLGHYIVADWHQAPDEQQFAKALLHIASDISPKQRDVSATARAERGDAA